MTEKKPTNKELKQKAQDLLMAQIAGVGYGSEYQDFIELCEGDAALAYSIVKKQMDRIARMFGYEEAWFA